MPVSRCRRLPVASLLAAIALLVAGVGLSGCVPEEDLDGESSCSSDADCSDGAECRSGHCVAALTCPGGQELCQERCVDYDSDPANCGDCGHDCVLGEVCSNGRCALVCGPGLVECAGRCIDPLTDREHCGASGDCAGDDAGETCRPGFVCSGGACALSCQSGLVDCAGTCIDPLTSRPFCGASGDCTGANAGEACGAGEVCTADGCDLSCPAGLVRCGNRCVDPERDPVYCGAAGDCEGTGSGEECASGEVCFEGVCTLSCPDPLVACDGSCVDAMTDPRFCGAQDACEGDDRGEVCGDDQFCAAGTCISYCGEGLTTCEGVCHDLLHDVDRCGDCDHACPEFANASPICAGGVCGPSCDSGWGDCNGDPTDGCETDLRRNVDHCASCGYDCPIRANATRTCSFGTCGHTCNPNFGDCNEDPADGCEIDLRTTPDHCNACGNACPSRPNATRICVGGTCGYICNSGWGDCNGNPADGCEVNTLTSLTHCGGCGITCPNRPNATRTCNAGTCGFTCNLGFADCDGSPANGCETDLRTNLNSCGSCGNACPNVPNSTRTCNFGSCGFTCNSGWGDCNGVAADGCETNLQITPSHCGACGVSCDWGQSCVNGQCT